MCACVCGLHSFAKFVHVCVCIFYGVHVCVCVVYISTLQSVCVCVYSVQSVRVITVP